MNFDKLIVDDPNQTNIKNNENSIDLQSVDIEPLDESLLAKSNNSNFISNLKSGDALSNDTTSNQQASHSESEDSLKKMPFDSIIENVKLNRIANKEVCNYILNLLVNGEFDLEKNFVIQNMKSIMLMIQVIKCARPSLKVI